LLILEHGYEQGNLVAALLNTLGYTEINEHYDLQCHPRACSAVWPETTTPIKSPRSN